MDMLKNGVFLPDKGLGATLSAELAKLDAIARTTSLTKSSQKTIEISRCLSLWAEIAWWIDLDDLRGDRNTPKASRYGSAAAGLVAGDNGNRALSYLNAVTGPNVHG